QQRGAFLVQPVNGFNAHQSQQIVENTVVGIQDPQEHHGTGGHGHIFGNEHHGQHQREAPGSPVKQQGKNHTANDGDQDFAHGVQEGDLQGVPQILGAGSREQPFPVL